MAMGPAELGCPEASAAADLGQPVGLECPGLRLTEPVILDAVAGQPAQSGGCERRRIAGSTPGGQVGERSVAGTP
eukprot:14090786-Alexandrium_andersonii.AAC.1